MLREWGITNYIETKPLMSFWACVKKYGYPKFRQMACQGRQRTPKCCYYLKEKPAINGIKEYNIDIQFLGLQASESMVRRLSFLREHLIEKSVPYICDVDIRNSDTAFTTYEPENYAVPGDGHPTTHLNTLISNKIKRYVFDLNYRNDVLNQSLTWINPNKTRVEYFQHKIKSNPEWLESVKLKAEKKGISVDSMILLDALYMVEQESGD